MFKTLISTFLLCGSVFTSTPKNIETDVNTVTQINADGNSLSYLNGCYCFRNEFVDLLHDLNYIGDTYTIYQKSTETWQYVPHVSIYSTQYDIYIDYWVERITIEYDYDGTGYDDVNWYIEFYYEPTKTSDLNYQFDALYYVDYTLVDVNSTYRDMIFYFPQPIGIESVSSKLFNSLFTGSGNDVVEFYNGYYSVIYPNSSTMFNIFGAFVINNSIYNNFNYTNGNSYCDVLGTSISYEYIIDGTFKGSNNVLISNSLIPYRQYQRMLNVGVFSFVRDDVSYTFGEMIFSVVDAPVYMLSQLFSFELFGIQFYVAFMSIFTVLLVCFLIKKII